MQLIQITVNLTFLERSCEALERHITKITKRPDSGAAAGSSHLEPLKSQVFHDVRSEVEHLVEEALQDRVDEFLELGRLPSATLRLQPTTTGSCPPRRATPAGT